MNFTLPFLPTKECVVLGRGGRLPIFPPVRLSERERAQHVYVLGITGQGKSKLLQSLLFQDITAGRGVGLLDMHSDLATDLLAQLEAARFFNQPKNLERVVYFDPDREEGVIPFNVLNTGEQPYDTAAAVVEAFRRTWSDSLREAPRFSDILFHSLLVLIANAQTLCQLQDLLTDKNFRELMLEKAGQEERKFFHQRFDRYGRETPLMIDSVLNKASAFTINPRLRRVLGCQANRLDFKRIMDEGKVLIVDLGRCDGETRRLLGSLMTTGIEQAALARKQALSRGRRPFYFYIDEFASCVANEGSTLTFAQILSEARKFGLSLTLAHQTLGQLPSERLKAALGNIGTKIVFAVDREDAELMARKLFWVDGEAVKHEVANEYSQEKTHPVFYSLAEQWEKGVQQIQTLKPRTCFVKRPTGKVLWVHTLKVAENPLSETRLERLKRKLLQPWPQEQRRAEAAQREDFSLSAYEEATPKVGRVQLLAG